MNQFYFKFFKFLLHLSKNYFSKNIYDKMPIFCKKPSYKVYTNAMLLIYDFFVLSFSNTVIWRCSSNHILKLYKKCISDNHLEIGVGTGYFLKKSIGKINDNSRLVLMDINSNCLKRALKNIHHKNAECRQIDIFHIESIKTKIQSFDSIGLNYVLHCLPGAIAKEKVEIIQCISQLLNPGGLVFGSTIISNTGRHSRISLFFSFLYNNILKTFNNKNDTYEDLKKSFNSCFSEVQITQIGSVALFIAKK